jgi:hypothetical protein
MWRTRKEFLRSCASLFVLFGCLAFCVMIVATQWPEKKHNEVARPTDAPAAVVRFTALQGAEVVPVVYQTGTIRPIDPRR